MKRIAILLMFFIMLFTVTDIGNLKVKAATVLPVSLSYSSQVIPTSTSLLSQGVVLDGKPTYRVTVSASVTTNYNFSGATVTFNNPNTTNVVSVGTATSTLNPIYIGGGLYSATVSNTYDVRGTVSSFSCTATVGGTNYSGTKTSTISFNTPCNYTSTFRITYYVIAKESDYTGSYTSTASGISTTKLFKSAFLSAVKLQGSGYSHYNEYMQYNPSTGNFLIVTTPKTAMGTTPTVNKTIAVDPYFIPRRSGNLAKVRITDVGDRQAEDGGGAITGYKIDVFYGTGLPSTVPSWSTLYKNVYYFGNNLW
jgi:3D (Asp-Asp-Asp) domain-containing protein